MVVVAEGESGENAFGFGFEGVAVVFDEFGYGFVVFGGVLIGIFAEFAMDGFHFRGNRGGEFEDGFVAGGGAFLGKKSESGAALEDDGAGIGGIFAKNEREKGGFSGTIGADEADAVTRIDLKRGCFEKNAASVGFGEL